jgi:hypothetical protein
MAFAYITEYIILARDGVGTAIPAGMEPAVTVQKLAIGAGSVQSAAFNPLTKFVCINVDAPCSIKFGANPTASAADARMPLDGTQYFGVIPGDKVAVITNT